jgi:hypothetical protein
MGILLGEKSSRLHLPSRRKLPKKVREALPGAYHAAHYPIKFRIETDDDFLYLKYTHPALKVRLTQRYYLTHNNTFKHCDSCELVGYEIGEKGASFGGIRKTF